MRDFSVFFGLGGLFGVGWPHNMAYQSLLSFRWRGWWDAAFLCKTGREKASWELTALGLLVEREH